MEIPFVGGAYLGRSPNLNAQVCQNLYPVVDQQGGKSVLALFGVPGLTGYLNLLTGGGGVITVYDDLEEGATWARGNLSSLSSPTSFRGSMQNVDCGSDGVVTGAMLGATPILINTFGQNVTNGNKGEIDFAMFPLTIDGHILDSFTASKTPCVIRRSTYSIVGFSAYSLADGINGNFIEIFKDNAITRKTLTYSNASTVHGSPFWMEAYDNGVIVIAYLGKVGLSTENVIKVMRSIDYGETWTTINILETSGHFATPTLFKGSNNNLYIACIDTTSTKRIRFWVSQDSGATWTQKTIIANFSGTAGIVCGCANDTTIYVAHGSTYSASASGAYIYYSTDLGNTWTLITQATWRSLSGIAVYGTTLIACAKLTSDLFTPSAFRVQISTDGGVTWAESLTPPTDATGPYPYNHSLRVYGSTFTYTYDGLKDGVNLSYYVSTDSGATWTSESLGRVAG